MATYSHVQCTLVGTHSQQTPRRNLFSRRLSSGQGAGNILSTCEAPQVKAIEHVRMTLEFRGRGNKGKITTSCSLIGFFNKIHYLILENLTRTTKRYDGRFTPWTALYTWKIPCSSWPFFQQFPLKSLGAEMGPIRRHGVIYHGAVLFHFSLLSLNITD